MDRLTDSATATVTPAFHYEASTADVELYELFRAGDSAAFAIIFNSYRLRLFRVAFRILRNHEDACDAVQDAMLKAFTAAPSFRADSHIASWLTRIVVNTSLMNLRKHRSHKVVSLDSEIDGSNTFADFLEGRPTHIVEDLIADEQRQIAFQAIAALEPESRKIFSAHLTEGVQMTMLAVRHDTSVAAIKGRLHRTRKILRERCVPPVVANEMPSLKQSASK
jgi:RNA polymerase sigma-70 factor, ECF subfamily